MWKPLASFSYLMFLATSLYAVAFVGGFGVPTHLDGPLRTGFGRAVAIDASLFAVAAIQHSVIGRRATSLAAMLLLWQWHPLGGPIWSVENLAAQVLLWTLFACGCTLVLLTLLGNRVVRQVQHLGFLLAFWMTPTMGVARLTFAVGTTAYIILATQLEARSHLPVVVSRTARSLTTASSAETVMS